MTDRYRDLPQQLYDERRDSEKATEIADALVEAGIGSERGGYYSHLGSGFLSETQSARQWFRETAVLPDVFLADWRVAGACLERIAESKNTMIVIDLLEWIDYDVVVLGEAMGNPRAICGAFAVSAGRDL